MSKQMRLRRLEMARVEALQRDRERLLGQVRAWIDANRTREEIVAFLREGICTEAGVAQFLNGVPVELSAAIGKVDLALFDIGGLTWQDAPKALTAFLLTKLTIEELNDLLAAATAERVEPDVAPWPA